MLTGLLPDPNVQVNTETGVQSQLLCLLCTTSGASYFNLNSNQWAEKAEKSEAKVFWRRRYRRVPIQISAPTTCESKEWDGNRSLVSSFYDMLVPQGSYGYMQTVAWVGMCQLAPEPHDTELDVISRHWQWTMRAASICNNQRCESFHNAFHVRNLHAMVSLIRARKSLAPSPPFRACILKRTDEGYWMQSSQTWKFCFSYLARVTSWLKAPLYWNPLPQVCLLSIRRCALLQGKEVKHSGGWSWATCPGLC